MRKIISLSSAALALLCLVGCEGNGGGGSEALEILEGKYRTVNSDFVVKTVIPTYRGLADNNALMADVLAVLSSDEDVNKACEYWKAARQYWEWSEAFLFGPATDFAIDPHTDTWPFDKTKFEAYMEAYEKYDLADEENEEYDSYRDILEEAIALGQNLTGFHAVEYLLFREGSPRKFADITSNEKWFAKTATKDLYLASLKLVSAWGGAVSEEEQEILDEAEFESRDYGADFKNAGNAGSTYSTVTLATRQIISGAQDIIGEVRDSKIGSPYHGKDVNYIESPHAYNSITDFYDNIVSCRNSLYGGMGAESPSSSSLIGVCLTYSEFKSYAQTVQTTLEAALTAIDGMKRPFVLYYQDASVATAIDALDELDDALTALDNAIALYE